MSQIKKHFYLIFILCLLFFVLGSNFAMAGIFSGGQQSKIEGGISATSGFLGLTSATPAAIAAAIAKALLSVVGAVFMILIIWAGVRWMTAGGNEDKIKKAKHLITNTVIAGALVLTASSISYIVIVAIEAGGGGKTTTPPSTPTAAQCTIFRCCFLDCSTVSNSDCSNGWQTECCSYRNMPWPTPNRCDNKFPECVSGTGPVCTGITPH